MKASDSNIGTNEEFGLADRAQPALTAYIFERTILDHCNGNNMDRVVVAIDHGEQLIVVDGVRVCALRHLHLTLDALA
jgi:hypothetical protein